MREIMREQQRNQMRDAALDMLNQGYHGNRRPLPDEEGSQGTDGAGDQSARSGKNKGASRRMNRGHSQRKSRD